MRHFATLTKKRWITAIFTLVLAFLSGHFMQSVVAGPPYQQTAHAVLAPKAPLAVREVQLRTPPYYPGRVLETRSPRKGGCLPRAVVEAVAPANVRVALTAPCHAGKPVRFSLNGIFAEVKTDAMGKWEARVPALARDIQIAFEFAGNTLRDKIVAEAADQLQHVVLAWSGPQTFRIRAEVSQGVADEAAGDPVRFGDNGAFAFEVFSFPASGHGTSGVVRLAVDAEVTVDNCGKRASVTAYQTGFSGQLRPTEIAYTMPSCDRVGEIVRLQNLFRDMRLAAR